MIDTSEEEVRVYRKATSQIKDLPFIATALLLQTTKLTEAECRLRGTVTDAGYDEIYNRHLRDALKASLNLAKFDAEGFKNSMPYIRKMGIRFDLAGL